jgi:hypothetical protein
MLSFILVFGSGIFAAQVGAETLIGSNVDNRIIVALRVGQAELQSWLPAPWQVNPIPGGPLKDANLYVIFVDRLLGQDAQGKPTAGGTMRAVALVAPAKNTQTGKPAPFVLRIYVPHEDISLYNPYKNSVQANIRREQTLKGADLEPGTGSELWELRDRVGGMLQFRMEYQRAVPRRAKQEFRPRSAVEPTFFRIYRVDQWSDLVKSIPAGINRVQNYQLRVTVSELSKLFDGTEQLIGIMVVPWYVRKLSLP